MKLGSIGEIQPSTMGSSGFTLRIALPAAIAISANFFQSGSILKSQREGLLGSFQSITASTIRAFLYRSLSPYKVPESSRSRRYLACRCTRRVSQAQVSDSGCIRIWRPELNKLHSAARRFGAQ